MCGHNLLQVQREAVWQEWQALESELQTIAQVHSIVMTGYICMYMYIVHVARPEENGGGSH